MKSPQCPAVATSFSCSTCLLVLQIKLNSKGLIFSVGLLLASVFLTVSLCPSHLPASLSSRRSRARLCLSSGPGSSPEQVDVGQTSGHHLSPPLLCLPVFLLPHWIQHIHLCQPANLPRRLRRTHRHTRTHTVGGYKWRVTEMAASHQSHKISYQTLCLWTEVPLCWFIRCLFICLAQYRAALPSPPSDQSVGLPPGAEVDVTDSWHTLTPLHTHTYTHFTQNCSTTACFWLKSFYFETPRHRRVLPSCWPFLTKKACLLNESNNG